MASSVLFIISIPTEEEEERLKHEFLARKFDIKSNSSSNNNNNNNNNPSSLAQKVIDNTTPKSTAPSLKKVKTAPTLLVPTPTSAIQNVTATTTTTTESNQGEGHEETNENSETISDSTIDVQSVADNMPNGAAVQYGTFPKRRKSDKPKRVEVVTEGVIKTAATVGGSLKDVDINSADGSIQSSRKSWEGLRKPSKKKLQVEVELTQSSSMELVLKELLRKFQIQNAVWAIDDEGRMYQITFTVEFNEIYEKLLDYLNEWGIGDREGSTVSVMNCIASKTFSQKEDNELENEDDAENNLDQKQGAWERFMNSVRSRLNVTQIVQNVRQDASITFDFLVLLISAAILAAFGLVENSTIFLASSMLISPLMGPIIATIFGTVIKDKSLGRLGLKNELIGILVAILVGFVFGIIICSIDERYSSGDGLTNEILSRCEIHSLIVGVFTAIPSGAAAAIGILGGNIGSLVGVAISASLLPPAVNSGILWSLAVIYKFFEHDETRYSNVVKTMRYSNDQATELAILGSMSMCLTISNIICIYIMGILVLKVKEIAPLISSNNREFWKHDIKIARGLKRHTMDGDNAIMDEFTNLPQEDQKALGINYEFLRTISHDESAYQNTWSPAGRRHPLETSYEPLRGNNYSTVHPRHPLETLYEPNSRGNYMTIHPLEQLYTTITQQVTMRDKRPRFSMPRRATGRLAESATSYKILSENIPRCSTMPSKNVAPNISVASPNATATAYSSKCNSESSTPTGTKRRKFIVTPAENDPLQPLCGPNDEEA